ncbi:hypothetical protein LINGRAHAP2_LOCUS8717, partial [Linum grandiflorum]
FSLFFPIDSPSPSSFPSTSEPSPTPDLPTIDSSAFVDSRSSHVRQFPIDSPSPSSFPSTSEPSPTPDLPKIDSSAFVDSRSSHVLRLQRLLRSSFIFFHRSVSPLTNRSYVSLFEDPPSCKAEGGLEMMQSRGTIGFAAER